MHRQVGGQRSQGRRWRGLEVRVRGVLEEEGAADLPTYAPFTNPLAILDGAREWLWGGSVAGSPVSSASVPLPLYALAAAVLLAVIWAVLALRYRSVST